MSKLRYLIWEAVIQADKAYEEAIKAREQLDLLLNAIPVSQGDYYKEVRGIQEQAVQNIATTYDVKHDLEELQDRLQALESVKGE